MGHFWAVFDNKMLANVWVIIFGTKFLMGQKNLRVTNTHQPHQHFWNKNTVVLGRKINILFVSDLILRIKKNLRPIFGGKEEFKCDKCHTPTDTTIFGIKR